MSILYLTQPGSMLSKKYEAFKVAIPQEDGTWKKQSVAAQTVEQIVLMGNPSISGDALCYALELGMPVHYLSSFGKHLGSALPSYSKNGQLRLAQYALHADPERRLELVKTIVSAKIHNQYNVLYRRGQKDNPLKQYKAQVWKQENLNQVRGIEGTAAREYFARWPELLPEGWEFLGRSHHRRPAGDRVNALLNFSYGLLRVQVTAAAHMAGLDPYIGYLHETTRGQPALVLDLMEEMRALVADNLVLSVLGRKAIQPEDFTESLGSFRLEDKGRRAFLEAANQKFNSEFKHPVFGYRCTYQRAIELQARLLGRHLQENVPYKPLVLR